MPNAVILYGDEVTMNGKMPFTGDAENNAYYLFMELAKLQKISLYLAHYKQYKKGKVGEAWCFDRVWKKERNVCVDVVMDKYVFSEKTRALKKEIEKNHPVLNLLEIEDFCKDKTAIYEAFPEYVPACYVVNNKKEYAGVLNTIPSEKIVIKPRYGLEGRDVRIIEKTEDPGKIQKDTLIQAFVDSSAGIPGAGIKGVHDIRLVFVDGMYTNNQVRLPKTGLISNAALGGKKIFLEKEHIPSILFTISKKIHKRFKHIPLKVYTIDFVFDKQGKPWIIEMNTKPGIVKFPGALHIQITLQNALLRSLKKAVS